MIEKLFENKESQSKIVHCEIYGDETSLENTVILVKIDGVIVLKNLNDPTIDFNNRIIYSNGNQSLKFYSELTVPDDLKQLFGRIFSIVNDEDDIEQSTALMSTKGIKNFSGRKLLPFAEHIEKGIEILDIPPTMFFPVIDNHVKSGISTCENWDIDYKSIGIKYRYKNILEEKKEDQIFGIKGILWPGFDVAVSNCCQKNPNGTGYLFKTDRTFKTINFCCNESAVDFCKKNKVIVYYSDFLNNGKLRTLSQYTENVNRKLQNTYLFRSSNI